MQMAPVQNNYGKWFILILLLFACVNCSGAKLKPNKTNVTFFDFEQFKRNLFTVNKVHGFSNQDDEKCLTELNAIANGLNSRDQWAMKLYDAWGKIPSGLYDGNTYDFGSFPECFRIGHNPNLFKTKYCLGQLDLNESFTPQAYIDGVDLGVVPAMWHPDTPYPVRHSSIITFGLCVPAICSSELLENLLKFYEIINDKKVSVEFNKNNCQLEEGPTKFRTIDCIAIGLVAIVSILAFLSTTYDIICAICHRKKSELLLAFSFYTNGKKLFSYERLNSTGSMDCFDGLRALTSHWIVFSHTLYEFFKLPIRNKLAIVDFFAQYRNMIYPCVLSSVDTFFVMSGLLVSLNILTQLEKTKGKINIPQLYLHRYLRLMPLLGVTILFQVSLLRYFGNGPIWPKSMKLLVEPCEKNWWPALLFIQNYVDSRNICLGHTWYAAVDTQLFVLSPFFIYAIRRFKAKAVITLVLLNVASCALILVNHVRHNLRAPYSPHQFPLNHYPTHVRLTSWFIGFFFGYILFNCQKRSIHIPKIINLFGWTLSLAAMVGHIFAMYPLQQFDSTISPLMYGLYTVFSRIIWSLAICYIIFACINNSGGIINRFLSHPLWQPLARISYAAYLMQYLTLLPIMIATTNSAYDFSETLIFNTSAGSYLATVFASVITILLVQTPIEVIERVILSSKTKKLNQSKKE